MSEMVYRFKSNAHLPKGLDAQTIGEELARLLGSASATWQALRTQAVNTGECWAKVGPAEQAMSTAQANLDAFDADHS